MMYAIYSKTKRTNSLHFQIQKENIHLYGCNVGILPKALRAVIPKAQSEPYLWHLPIESCLDDKKTTVIIDIRPDNKEYLKLLVCELVDVWGHSDKGWTPILMRMNVLLNDEDPAKYDKADFKVPDEGETVYSFLHLAGGVKDGELVGKWTAPRPSPTNSTLLSSETFDYFMKCIRNATPNYLKAPEVLA